VIQTLEFLAVLALLCAGSFLVFGLGWALIVAGLFVAVDLFSP
jgi:hypothetical protein